MIRIFLITIVLVSVISFFSGWTVSRVSYRKESVSNGSITFDDVDALIGTNLFITNHTGDPFLDYLSQSNNRRNDVD